MDLINLGSTDLRLRLAFQDPTVGPPTNVAFSTSPIALPSGSGWTRVAFPVTAGDLTAAQGTVAAALSGTTALYLYHSDVAAPPGNLTPAVVAQLGVDNITAVPEPGAALLIGLGLSALASRRSPRR